MIDSVRRWGASLLAVTVITLADLSLAAAGQDASGGSLPAVTAEAGRGTNPSAQPVRQGQSTRVTHWRDGYREALVSQCPHELELSIQICDRRRRPFRFTGKVLFFGSHVLAAGRTFENRPFWV